MIKIFALSAHNVVGEKMFAVTTATRLFLSVHQSRRRSSALLNVSSEWTFFCIVLFTFEKSVFLNGLEQRLITLTSILVSWGGGKRGRAKQTDATWQTTT